MACNDDAGVPVSRDRCPNYKKDASPNNLPTMCRSCVDKTHCYPAKKDDIEDDGSNADGRMCDKRILSAKPGSTLPNCQDCEMFDHCCSDTDKVDTGINANCIYSAP